MEYRITKYLLSGVFFLLFSLRIDAQVSADIRYTVDEVSPKVYCINGLAINFTDNHRVRTISAREINLGSSDNLGIKGFKIEKHRPEATTPEEDAMAQMTFKAKDLGKHKIDLWVEDFGGNWARKSTYVVVSDLALKEQGLNNLSAGNYPNPFSEQTRISFEMPISGPVRISILNSKGILFKKIEFVYPKGKQFIEINRSDLPGVGVFYYQITTKQGSITKNMIMVNY